MPIPPTVFLQALADLRPLLPAGEAAQMALNRLLASGVAERLKSEHLVGDSDTLIQQLADATSSEPSTIVFVLNTVLSPFFEKLAGPYREWVGMAGWRRGICPMCGSEPWMARLAADNGQRILACSLCRTEWTFDRLRCPFCEGDDQPRLRHFVIEGDDAHRVYCCDRCQRYIKTVDERVSARPANLLVEDMITPHLDILARDQGYQ
jgi:FdhE protein